MLEVVAGIIERENFILICKRAKGRHLEGYWELPGGKVREAESHQRCLVRELLEELALSCRIGEFVAQVTYDYEEITVKLHAYRVTIVSGDIQLVDHDSYKWVSREKVLEHQLAPADIPILKEFLKLFPTT